MLLATLTDYYSDHSTQDVTDAKTYFTMQGLIEVDFILEHSLKTNAH